jgi:glutamine amidotransferase
MRAAIDNAVLSKKVPILGICVGMQMLANSSDEGELLGLGWIPGKVRGFKSISDLADLPLPHMGWNDIAPDLDCPLFKDLELDSRFYFLHSYFFECTQKEHAVAQAVYGLAFSCAVASNNIYGVQFHPEKSHHFGVALLKNFAEL